MESLQQCDSESYRVIVLGRDRTELLLVPRETGFQLPSIEIPRWQRLAENLTSAVKSKWNCEAVCLFTLAGELASNSTGSSYQVMECCKRPELNAGDMVWLPTGSLSEDSFREAADHAALQRCFVESDAYAEDATSPFAKPNWFRELQTWITGVILPLGLHLNGHFRQFNAGPSFSLIRFETSGSAIWFKAVGEPNQREYPITLRLAELFPNFLPRIIACRPDWNGWLSFEAEGRNLAETRELNSWQTAAATLARLQIGSASKVEYISASGVLDSRGTALSSSVHRYFDVVTRLMRQQTKVPPPILSDNQLGRLEDRILESLRLLRDLDIPDALGHLDLNPGNIMVSQAGCIFLDWAEAYVGNPFLSFEYLREHFRRSVSAEPELEAQLLAQYRAPWERVLSREAIAEVLALAPLLAVFGYAAGLSTWKDEKRLRDTRAAGYLRSLVRRMNREALQLERRTLCLS